MLLGARQFFERRGGGWQNPYVTDGLEAMWDAIWNVGPETHDSNTTTWVDLSGNERNLTCYGGVPNWSSDSCNITKKDEVYHTDSAPWFRQCWEANSGIMVEVVMRNSNPGGMVFGFGGERSSWQSWDIQRTGVNADKAYALWRDNSVRVLSDWKYKSQESWIVRAWANQSSAQVWNYSDTATGQYTYQSYAGNGLSIAYSGFMGLNPSINTGDYQSIRVYSHILTDAEMAQNNAIDKERFNMP